MKTRKPAKKTSPQKKHRPKKPARQTIRAKHWKKSTTIAADKYQAVSKAILAALPKKGMGWMELMGKVDARLPKFEGSLWWYALSVLRELETRGKVKRVVGRPVMYYKR